MRVCMNPNVFGHHRNNTGASRSSTQANIKRPIPCSVAPSASWSPRGAQCSCSGTSESQLDCSKDKAAAQLPDRGSHTCSSGNPEEVDTQVVSADPGTRPELVAESKQPNDCSKDGVTGKEQERVLQDQSYTCSVPAPLQQQVQEQLEAGTMLFPKPHTIPVFVMLPLDTVTSDGVFKYAGSAWFSQSLHLLANSGAYGVAIDVWWGAVEREPGQYTWTGYRQLFELIRNTGLKLQAVLSFHACGGNVGDTAHVPLPSWVLRCGENDPDLFFTDRPRGGNWGQRNKEYISVWADDAPGALCGRSPMQCYEDLMVSFKENFLQELGCLVEEVVVGAGPCGELRFPSYVEGNGWRFPGVGEFQCYDRRALASLAQAAREWGQPEWGYGGPHDTGDYNSSPEETGFYHHGGSWDSAYGRFFLEWYSRSLLQHGDRLMATARRIFGPPPPRPVGSSCGTQQGGGSGKPSCPSSDASSETRVDASPQPSLLTRRHASGMLSQQQYGVGSGGGGGAGSAAYIPMSVADRRLEELEVEQSEASAPSSIGELPSSDMALVVAEVASTGSGGSAAERGTAGSAGPLELGGAGPSMRSEGTHLLGMANGIACVRGRGANELGSRAAGFMLNSQGSLVDAMSVARDLAGDDASECVTPDRLSGMAADEAMQGDFAVGTAAACEAGPSSMQGTGPGASEAETRHGHGVTLTLKIAGIHWWFRSRSHAAELTAGYYNTATRDGYAPVVDLCVKHEFSLTITCVEMCDTQHPALALCGPEGLLKQIRSLCASRGVQLSGENALPIFLVDGVDTTAMERIVYNTRVWPGAAVMAAYLSMRGHGRVTSPDTMPLGSPVSGGFYYNGSAGNLAVLHQQVGWYRHAGHASTGDVVTHYRGSDTGTLGSAALSTLGTMAGHAGGAAAVAAASGRQAPLLWPARSDPAIAATGLRGDSYADISEPLPPMRAFTFLRLAPVILQPSYQGPWMKFMWKMREGGFC